MCSRMATLQRARIFLAVVEMSYGQRCIRCETAKVQVAGRAAGKVNDMRGERARLGMRVENKRLFTETWEKSPRLGMVLVGRRADGHGCDNGVAHDLGARGVGDDEGVDEGAHEAAEYVGHCGLIVVIGRVSACVQTGNHARAPMAVYFGEWVKAPGPMMAAAAMRPCM